MVRAARERVGRLYDGWFPNAPDAAGWGTQFREIRDIARDAGRNPEDVTGAIYLTLTIDEDAARANQRMDGFMEHYYGQPATAMRGRQANYAGPATGAGEWLKSYVDEGASHLVLRFAGDAEHNMDAVVRLRQELGW